MSEPTLQVPAPMPVTEADLDMLRSTVYAAVSRADDLFDLRLCPTGALVRVHFEKTTRTLQTLRAAGYTVTAIEERSGHLHVSGVADQVAILDAEIARLTELREQAHAERGES